VPRFVYDSRVSRPLTYADFYRTGIQDCGNVMSPDEFNLAAGTPRQIVELAWARWEAEGMEEQWLSQQDDFEGLDPHQCYENWKAGWITCATGEIENAIEQREEEAAENPPPKHWWRRPAPKQRLCYPTKADALKVFLDVNSDIVENYGGADYAVSPSEFDAINHKYDLKGKRAVKTIADAVWAAMPVGKPYCLDRIDLDALNDTSPAHEAGVAFRLPDYVYEAQLAEEEARRIGYGEVEPELPDWVTEHEHEPHRVFPPLPSMEGITPFGARLERREPGVETYQLYQERPLGPPASQEVKPVKLQLEEREPGVETYSMSNPARKTYQVEQQDQYGNWKVTDRGVTKKYADDTARWARSKGGTARVTAEAAFRSGVHVEAETPRLYREFLRLATPYVATRSGDGTFIVLDEHRWANLLASCDAREIAPKDNPAWVTKILAKHYVALEEEIPPKWLPKLTKPGFSGGKLTAAMKEYGCGAYGCVLPTLDPKVVLKLTTDSTEAEFAQGIADKLSAPVVVKYHLARALPDRYKQRGAYLLWRDSADKVGQVLEAVAERAGDIKEADTLITAQHKAAQKAFDALDEGKPAQKLIDRWEEAAREMGEHVPELRELAENMIKVLHRDKVFFGDVHDGNIGFVNGHWVIVDPGHVAVLQG
jgi:hypothetical protein